jgi:hypothetical protein
MVAGRTSEPRSMTIGTTNTSTAITGAAGTFNEEDAGRSITGTGIPAGATIASVTSDTAAVLSAAATATGSPTATLPVDGGSGYGFIGWSPLTDAESETYTVTAVNAAAVTPDRIVNSYTAVQQRSRT